MKRCQGASKHVEKSKSVGVYLPEAECGLFISCFMPLSPRHFFAKLVCIWSWLGRWIQTSLKCQMIYTNFHISSQPHHPPKKQNQTKKSIQPNPTNKQRNKQTNPTQTWMPNHLKNLFRENMDLMTVWGSSLTAEILLIQLQHKINVGTETKISGLKLKKIQAEEEKN